MNNKKILRDWTEFNRFEEQQKKSFLRNLSGKAGLKIFFEMHEFARLLNPDIFINKGRKKIKTLIRTHKIFNRVCKIKK